MIASRPTGPLLAPRQPRIGRPASREGQRFSGGVLS